MNPWMNTNEATNNMHRKEQDIAHKAAIGELTKIVRAAQQSPLTELKAENSALKAEIESLRKDAERYRWLLKEHYDADGNICVDGWVPGYMERWEPIEDLDDHIDAAIAAAPKEK